MRPWPTSILLLLALPALSGCLASDSDDEGDGDGPTPTPAAAYQLDCTISNWAEPCLAMASPNDSPAKAEVDIAVNPADPMNVFVASKDKDPLASPGCVWAVGQYTTDGGKTWATTYVGGKTAERQPMDLLYGWDCITDPILAYEPDGTLHYSLQVYRYRPLGPDPTGQLPDGGNMYQAVSRDGGATFSEILPMHYGDSGALLFHDFMRMGTSPTTSTTFTIWDQLTASASSLPVMVAVERQGDQYVVRPPVYCPNSDPNLVSLGIGAVFGDRDGTVYAWLSGFNSGGRAVLATSDDDGLTFTEARQVFSFEEMAGLEDHPCSQCPTYEPGYCDHPEGTYVPCYRTGTVVELAPDLSEAGQGCLYAAWSGNEAEAVGGSDIYLRSSCDKGATWSEPTLVNTQRREDAQWMPRVSVDGRGTVHLVYYTRAYDPEHNLIDAEHAYSTDGGRNWTHERLTATSFDGNLGIHQDGFPFIGDYIGISSAGDHTYMGFPSTVTGRAEIAVAHSVHVAPAGNGTA